MASPAPTVNPKPFVRTLIGKMIRIKLKWGMEYVGSLKYADAYVNLAMENVYEYVNECCQGYMPELIIRCNNILYVREFSGPLEFPPPSSEKGKKKSQEEEEEEEESS